jgi:hypothetical protein
LWKLLQMLLWKQLLLFLLVLLLLLWLLYPPRTWSNSGHDLRLRQR